MTIRKIMTPFTSLSSCDAAFAAAAPLARRFGALIDVVHVRQRPQVAGDFYYPMGLSYVDHDLDTLNAKADELSAALEERFAALCARWRIPVADAPADALDAPPQEAVAAWTSFDGDPYADLAYRARVADLVVAAPGKGADGGPPVAERALFEDMIFQSGRPVLLAAARDEDGAGPAAESPGGAFPGKVLVAWDGKREAARAMHAALPILKACDLAIVATAGDTEWAAQAPLAAAAYLRLHAVPATHLHLRPGRDGSPEEMLLEEARKKQADLIVMGAYSHQRWRQIVLGGFTRHLLKTSTIPLLMTH